MLPSLTEIDWKGETFPGKILFLECSPRRVKRSFENPVENYSKKNRNFFLEL